MNNWKSPEIRGSLWMITGFLACPCHLPVTVPLLLGLTAGTAFGAFLANNIWIVGAVSTAYFLIALALGFSTLRQKKVTSATEGQTDDQFACCTLNEAPAAETIRVAADR